MNPYELKTTFTTLEAACALVGVYDEREAPAKVRAVRRELEHVFPPIREQGPARTDFITGARYSQARTRSARIHRADLLAWCEARNIRPPLLFPDPPPAPSPEPERPLHESERATLLRIIRALAELQDVKQTGDAYRSEATRLLQKCSSKGIADPCTDKSLAKHLKAAFDSR